MRSRKCSRCKRNFLKCKVCTKHKSSTTGKISTISWSHITRHNLHSSEPNSLKCLLTSNNQISHPTLYNQPSAHLNKPTEIHKQTPISHPTLHNQPSAHLNKPTELHKQSRNTNLTKKRWPTLKTDQTLSNNSTTNSSNSFHNSQIN